jgi:hypothetical protein
MENNKNLIISYKKHIIDLLPISMDMVYHILTMKQDDIQEIILCYDNIIQNLLKNGYR